MVDGKGGGGKEGEDEGRRRDTHPCSETQRRASTPPGEEEERKEGRTGEGGKGEEWGRRVKWCECGAKSYLITQTFRITTQETKEKKSVACFCSSIVLFKLPDEELCNLFDQLRCLHIFMLHILHTCLGTTSRNKGQEMDD